MDVGKRKGLGQGGVTLTLAMAFGKGKVLHRQWIFDPLYLFALMQGEPLSTKILLKREIDRLF